MKKLYSSKKIGFKYQGNLSKKLRQYKNKQGKFKQNRYSSRKIQIRHKYPTRVRNKYTKKGGTNSPKISTQDLIGNILYVINNETETDSQNIKVIVNAVNELIQEGLNIKFVLLEGIENNRIASFLSQEADILIDQLIAQGYALNALEGMSSELPVIANIEDSNLMNLFRTYSFLDECPIYSANPFNIKDRIKELVLDEALRAELGKKGRKFVFYS